MARRRRGKPGPKPEELGLKVTEQDVLKQREKERQAKLDQTSELVCHADGSKCREPKEAEAATG